MDIYTIEDIYSSLPAYQAERLRQLVELHGEEKAAEIWLNSIGPKYASHFGGEISTSTTTFFDRCKIELDKLICGHTDYEEEHSKFIGTSQSITIAIATAIGTWLSTIVSISAVILVPAVELILHSIFKIGVSAYCSNKIIE